MPDKPRRPLVYGLAWDRDRLVVTTDEALEKIDKPHLSASTAKAIHTCPARHAGDRLLPEKVDLFAPAPLGNAAHTVLERLYQMGPVRRDRRAATALLLALGREYTEQYPEIMSDPITYERWKQEVSRCYTGIFDMEDPTGVVSTYQERRLDGVLVAEVPFKGFIDRQDEICARGKTGARVVDYKTGKVPNLRYGDDHGDQIRLYGEAVRVLDGELPLEGKLYYTTHREVVTVPLGPKHMLPTLDAFHDAWTDLRSYIHERTFPTKVTPLCGWCPLVNACPAARQAAKTDRLGTAPSEVELAIPTLQPGAPKVVEPEPEKSYAPDFEPDLESPTLDIDDGNWVPDSEPDPSEFPGYKPPSKARGLEFDPYAEDDDLTPEQHLAILAQIEAELTSGPLEPEPTSVPIPPEAEQFILVPDEIAPPDDFEAPPEPAYVPRPEDYMEEPNNIEPENPKESTHGSAGELRSPHCDQGGIMSDTQWREGNPGDGSEIDGHLSLSSHAAIAVFEVVGLAVETLDKAGQRVTPSTVRAFSSLLARVLLDAQERVTYGDRDWQSGANARVRRALNTVLNTVPLPWGGSVDGWDRWTTAATRRCVSIAGAAIHLFDFGPSEDDLDVLADTTVAPENDTDIAA